MFQWLFANFASHLPERRCGLISPVERVRPLVNSIVSIPLRAIKNPGRFFIIGDHRMFERIHTINKNVVAEQLVNLVLARIMSDERHDSR